MKINHKEINNNKKLFKPKFLTLHYNFLICQVSPLKKKKIIIIIIFQVSNFKCFISPMHTVYFDEVDFSPLYKERWHTCLSIWVACNFK